jgi:D-glycero-D-manno-heptose 1,7-bisphosphate phosphatase
MTDEISLARRDPINFAGIKLVFLDRDGVINRKAPHGAYVVSWDDFEILPGVERAVAALNQADHRVVVVTNQRAIALGQMSESELMAIHAKLQTHLGAFGAHLDAIYYCPHDVGQCTCRKPATGLFERALADFPELRPESSVVIGDSYSDMVAGAAMKMKTIFITEDSRPDPRSLELANALAPSLEQAVERHLLR